MELVDEGEGGDEGLIRVQAEVSQSFGGQLGILKEMACYVREAVCIFTRLVLF